jgi:hypothetical protein
MWTLKEALTLVRTLQPKLWQRSYHMALGGGVLNRGDSHKDLDLYIFPFNGEIDLAPILPFLESEWGPSEVIGNEQPNYPPDVNFQRRQKFFIGEHKDVRIDVFILHDGVTR